VPRPRSPNRGHCSSAGLTLRRIAGHPALDFANTVDWDRPQPETLTDFGSLVAWCEETGLCTLAEAQRWTAAASSDVGGAARLHRQALQLRTLIVRLCFARMRARRASARDIAAFNGFLRKYSGSAQLVPNRLDYIQRSNERSALADPMRRLVALVAGFLTSSDFGHVRLCEGPQCGWFFIDRSPARRRRWCSMEGCGNRAKARMHYERRKAGFRGPNPGAGARHVASKSALAKLLTADAARTAQAKDSDAGSAPRRTRRQ
jgi:predicted RNA-binding Zn ribbon-like protein